MRAYKIYLAAYVQEVARGTHDKYGFSSRVCEIRYSKGVLPSRGFPDIELSGLLDFRVGRGGEVVTSPLAQPGLV